MQLDGFWYGSQLRPANGLFIPDVINIIAETDKVSDAKPYYSKVQTNKKLADEIVYTYDLTPLNQDSWIDIDIANFLEYDKLQSDDVSYLLEMPKLVLQPYLFRHIKDKNKYANALTVPQEQLEHLTELIIRKLEEMHRKNKSGAL